MTLGSRLKGWGWRIAAVGIIAAIAGWLLHGPLRGALASRLSDDEAAALPEVGTPPPSAQPSTVRALGRIEPHNGVVRVAGPSRPAVVIADLDVEEGDAVERGQILATLDTAPSQRAEVSRLEAEARFAERDLVRRKNLREKSAVADSEVEEAELRHRVARAELERARAELERSLVRSPISGRVLEVFTRAGERVGADGIVELGETSAMYAVAEVYETDVGRVRVGQRAAATSPALPGPLRGTVERIQLKVGKKDVLDTDPVADADARVVEVEVRLDDPEAAAHLTNLDVDVAIESVSVVQVGAVQLSLENP